MSDVKKALEGLEAAKDFVDRQDSNRQEWNFLQGHLAHLSIVREWVEKWLGRWPSVTQAWEATVEANAEKDAEIARLRGEVEVGDKQLERQGKEIAQLGEIITQLEKEIEQAKCTCGKIGEVCWDCVLRKTEPLKAENKALTAALEEIADRSEWGHPEWYIERAEKALSGEGKGERCPACDWPTDQCACGRPSVLSVPLPDPQTECGGSGVIPVHSPSEPGFADRTCPGCPKCKPCETCGGSGKILCPICDGWVGPDDPPCMACKNKGSVPCPRCKPKGGA